MITYWLITRMLAHMLSVSRDDDLLGGMWAVVATVFVYRYSYEDSVGAALSRMGATSLSFALCFIYLLFFPFHFWGMATLTIKAAMAIPHQGKYNPETKLNKAVRRMDIMYFNIRLYYFLLPIYSFENTIFHFNLLSFTSSLVTTHKG